MNLTDIRAELSMKSIELEQALDMGLPHSELIKIYRKIKELQYKLIMAGIEEKPSAPTTEIIE